MRAARRRAVIPPGPFLKTSAELDAIERPGRVVDAVLDRLRLAAAPGITTAELDALARQLLAAEGAIPAFPGLRDAPGGPAFPGALCASVNDEVLHAPPGSRVLRAGDLVTLDLGAQLDGWFADAALSLVVEDAGKEGQAAPHPCAGRAPLASPAEPADQLSLAARVAAGASRVLEAGLAALRPGQRWSAIATVMQEKADQLGLGIVTGFVGHGIGRHLHELPKAPAWWSPGGPPDFTLKPGLVLAIEPIVTSSPGLTPTELAPDGWTVRTRDNSLAAHVEAVVGIDPAGDRVRILAGRGALGG